MVQIDSEKVASIKAVQTFNEKAMVAVFDYLTKTTKPTSEGAKEVISTVLELAGCESSEGVIVACGPTSYEPHEEGSGEIKTGQPVVIDIFPRSRQMGYFADMTRTVCLGTAPKDLLAMYDAVKEAKALAVALIKPGVEGKVVHQAVADYFLRAGYITRGEGTIFKYEEGFVHSLGHGVGKAIHEKPILGSQSEDVLKVGDILTVEPGLYYKEIGGVRLEDMVLVTEDGCEVLTSLPCVLELK